MNTKFLFRPLGLSFDTRKCSIGAEAIAGSGGLIGSWLSAKAAEDEQTMTKDLTRETNEQNYKIHQEDLAAQRKQFEDSLIENRFLDERHRKWQLEDIESERAWNSAAAIAERYRQAGINPYLAMQSGAAAVMAGSGASSPSMASGSAPTGTGTPSAIPMQSPSRMMPYDIGAGINEALANFIRARASEQGIRKSEYDISADKLRLRMEEAESRARINKLEHEGLLSKNEADKVRYDLDFLKKVEGDRIKEFSLRNDEIAANIAYNKAETEFTNVQAEFARHNIKLTDMQIKRLKTLLPYEASLMAQQAAAAAAQANYYNTSAADIKNTFDARLRGLKADAKLKIAQALNIEGSERRTQEDFDNVWKHYIEPILGETIQAVGIGVGLWRGGAASAGRATQTVEHVQDKPFRYYDEYGDVRQGMNRTTTTTTQRINRKKLK